MPGGRPGRSAAARRKAVANGRVRDLQVAGADQEYACVTALLGNHRVRARFVDGGERQCRVRGSMWRREWVRVGDLVLVAARPDMAGDRGDVVCKYQPAEVQHLRRLGEPVGIAVDEEAETDDVVVFEGDDEGRSDARGTDARVVPAQTRRLDYPSSESEGDPDVDAI